MNAPVVHAHSKEASFVRVPKLLSAVAVLTVAAIVCPGNITAQNAGLQSGGDTVNFGIHPVTPGFLPDPMNVDVVSGGNLHATDLGIGPGCKGWVTRQPDVIVRLQGRSPNLRVYVTAQGNEDTTLIVQHANGSWRCNDDSWNTLNPTVNLPNASAGQYNIWVGSYREGVQAHSVLHITEISSNHP